MSFFEGGDDAVGVGGAREEVRIIVGLVDEAVDKGLEVGDEAEAASLEPARGELGEEGLCGAVISSTEEATRPQSARGAVECTK